MMSAQDLFGFTMCIAVLAVGLGARAEDHFRMLDGKQIQARFIGQDITDGPHLPLYLRPDGTIIGSESGSSWSGSWQLRGNRLCITLPSSTSLFCNEVWMWGDARQAARQ